MILLAHSSVENSEQWDLVDKISHKLFQEHNTKTMDAFLVYPWHSQDKMVNTGNDSSHIG